MRSSLPNRAARSAASGETGRGDGAEIIPADPARRNEIARVRRAFGPPQFMSVASPERAEVDEKGRFLFAAKVFWDETK
jgi:hypothetical protein